MIKGLANVLELIIFCESSLAKGIDMLEWPYLVLTEKSRFLSFTQIFGTIPSFTEDESALIVQHVHVNNIAKLSRKT